MDENDGETASYFKRETVKRGCLHSVDGQNAPWMYGSEAAADYIKASKEELE